MATNEEDILRRIRDRRQADILRVAGSTPRSPESRRNRSRLMALLDPETGAEVAASMAAGVNPLMGLTQDLYDIGAGAATRDPIRTIFGLGGLALTTSPLSGRKARQAAEEGFGRFKNRPIDDPAVREAVTDEMTGRLGVESVPEPPTPEEIDSAVQSVVRSASDPRSGNAFDFAVQRALMMSEDAQQATDAVRREFSDISDAEFAERFASAVDRVVETQRSLDASRGIRSLSPEQRAEKRFLEALFPQPQRSMREQGAGLEGSMPVRAEGLYDVETLAAPSSAPGRNVIRSTPTPMDLAASRIIQRRAGDIDIDEVPALRSGDPTETHMPVERLFDPEDVGDLRTYREQLEDRYGYIPKDLDINNILNELQDQFPDASRDELVNAVTNAGNAVSSNLAIRMGRETLQESQENAARFLMRNIDTGKRGEVSARRRRAKSTTETEEAAERLRQERFERAYSGDPLYMGAGTSTPKREYRLANPDWRKGLTTIPPSLRNQ